MKWLLLLMILSGYSGSSTVAANFDSKDVCEAAAKSHEEAIRRLHWHSFEIVWTCSQITARSAKEAAWAAASLAKEANWRANLAITIASVAAAAAISAAVVALVSLYIKR